MSWDQLLEPGIMVRDSPVESERFGRSIQRVTIGPGPVDVDHLVTLVADLPADVLIVRYDAARLELASAFARVGRAVIPAGALLYWEQPVSVAKPPGASNLEVLPADTLDLERVAALVREIVQTSFRDYGNHYTANPLLDRSAALAGYEDWAVRSLNSDPSNVLVMTDLGEPVGFAMVESGADGRHLEILLAGIFPNLQGKHLYGSLLDACERVAAARGAGQVVTSTQVHNVRGQRAWARQGLRPFASIETVHLVDRDLLQARPGGLAASDSLAGCAT